ncbi:MAG: hypothetical protein IPP13_03395 [Kouleothrix sp.]|nr:hypothetical protein [Kouleothrix sp.]
MTTAYMSPIELTQTAIRILVKELGIVNTARFIDQFTGGYGDYTAERDTLLPEMTVNELARAIQQQKQRPTS